MLAPVSLLVCGDVITRAVSSHPDAALHTQIMYSTAVERLKTGFHLAPIILELYTYTFNIKFDAVLYVCVLMCVCTNIKVFNGNSAKRWGVDTKGGKLT